MENVPKNLWSSAKTGAILYPAMILFLCIVGYSGSKITVSQTRKLNLSVRGEVFICTVPGHFEVSQCRIEYTDKNDVTRMTDFVPFAITAGQLSVRKDSPKLKAEDKAVAVIVLGPNVSLWTMLGRELGQ